MSKTNNNGEKKKKYTFPRIMMESWLAFYDREARNGKVLIQHYIGDTSGVASDGIFPLVCEYYSASRQANLMIGDILDDEARKTTALKNKANIEINELEMIVIQSYANLIKMHKEFLRDGHNISMELH